MKDDFIILYNSESWTNRIHRKSLSIELLEAAIVFYMIYIPVFGTLSIFLGNELIIRGMLMLPVNLLVAYLKCKAKSGKGFLVYNIAIITLVYFSYPTLTEKILYTIVQLVMLVMKLIKLNSQKNNFWKSSFLYFNGGFFSLWFLLMNRLDLEMGKTLITLAAIHNIICLLIYFHIIGRDNVFAWEEQNGSRLMHGMKKTSAFVISILTMTLVLINFLLWKLGIFRAVDAIKFSFGSNRNPINITENATEDIDKGFINAAENLEVMGGEPSPLLKLLITIIGITFVVVVVIILIYLIFNLIVRIRRFLLRTMGCRIVNEKHESILEEMELSLKLSRKIAGLKHAVEEISDLSYEKRIRNLYKKLVKGYKKKGIVPERHNTASDISCKLESVSEKNYAELTELYHKARYSVERCCREELENAKKYLKY
ncbi:hypothetical protein [Clostridium thermarum]|uniref:hypothetical protein n=1 Tax=Clostridium thermarum TaxID=1716543 RepID=UPI0013D897F3|nr:hypothetical protein [Clostridium thermarum]